MAEFATSEFLHGVRTKLYPLNEIKDLDTDQLVILEQFSPAIPARILENRRLEFAQMVQLVGLVSAVDSFQDETANLLKNAYHASLPDKKDTVKSVNELLLEFYTSEDEMVARIVPVADGEAVRVPMAIITDITCAVLNDPVRYIPYVPLAPHSDKFVEANRLMDAARASLILSEQSKLPPYIAHVISHQDPSLNPYVFMDMMPYEIMWPIVEEVVNRAQITNHVAVMCCLHGGILFERPEPERFSFRNMLPCASMSCLRNSAIEGPTESRTPYTDKYLKTRPDGSEYVHIQLGSENKVINITSVPERMTLHYKTVISCPGVVTLADGPMKKSLVKNFFNFWDKRHTFDIIKYFDTFVSNAQTTRTLDKVSDIIYSCDETVLGPSVSGASKVTKARLGEYVCSVQAASKLLDKTFATNHETNSGIDYILFSYIYFLWEGEMFILLCPPQQYFDDVDTNTTLTPEEKVEVKVKRPSGWVENTRNALLTKFNKSHQRQALHEYFDSITYSPRYKTHSVGTSSILTLLNELFQGEGDSTVNALMIDTSCQSFPGWEKGVDSIYDGRNYANDAQMASISRHLREIRDESRIDGERGLSFGGRHTRRRKAYTNKKTIQNKSKKLKRNAQFTKRLAYKKRNKPQKKRLSRQNKRN